MWTGDRPLYLQIRDRIADAILDPARAVSAALPSVRALAAELCVNPLTVAKAYNELQAAGFVEARKGVGLFAAPGARTALLAAERKRFLDEDLPAMRARASRLGLDAAELLAGA